MGWQWQQLDRMHIICTLLQIDNHTSTSSLKFFTSWMLFLMPNQQCQSTDSNIIPHFIKIQDVLEKSPLHSCLWSSLTSELASSQKDNLSG